MGAGVTRPRLAVELRLQALSAAAGTVATPRHPKSKLAPAIGVGGGTGGVSGPACEQAPSESVSRAVMRRTAPACRSQNQFSARRVPASTCFITSRSHSSVHVMSSSRRVAEQPHAPRGHRLALAVAIAAVLTTAAHLAPAANAASATSGPAQEDPEFTDYIENITVPAGRNVKLACSVKNLGTYKVAWMHFEQSAILTVHNHVITRNPRIAVSHDKHRTWFLHISNVQEEDKGRYMCQINTVQAKTQFGYLHVVVPPNIDDAQSSTDVIVREGANVTLTCVATGSPQPSVRWKRDDGNKININKTHAVAEWEGEVLELTRISRLDMGAYLCIATNGVPPTVSKRIKVSVDFPPMLWIPHQLVGAPYGYSVTLECITEAHPTSLNYWTREDGNMIHESVKYHAENTVGPPAYKTHMRLTIHNIHEKDYGSYKCVAKNPRGETDGSIRLYTSAPPSTLPPPTTQQVVTRRTPEPAVTWDKGTKFQSNLNEIDKSERKSSSQGESSKGSVTYDWPQHDSSSVGDRNAASVVLLVTLSALLLLTWSSSCHGSCHCTRRGQHQDSS